MRWRENALHENERAQVSAEFKSFAQIVRIQIISTTLTLRL